MFILAIVAKAQSNGMNPVFSLCLTDLTYTSVQKKTTAGDVIGTVVSAIAGSATDTHHEDYAPAVNAIVKSSFSHLYRLIPVENGSATDFVMSGTINNMSTTTQTRTRERKDSKGKIHKTLETRYDATVNVTINLKNTSTGEVMSHTFNSTGYSDYGLSSAQKALKAATDNLLYSIPNYYNTLFPISANIIERGGEKNDKQKQVYIDVGSASGTYNGHHFLVYIVGQVAGRETKREIGRLKVVDVLGDDISLCKVQRGGKDIKLALDTSKNIKVISSEESFTLF